MVLMKLKFELESYIIQYPDRVEVEYEEAA